MSNATIVAGLIVIALGSLAFVFTSGDPKPKKRQAALQTGGVKAKDSGIEKTARKKQIVDSLKELEKKARPDASEPRNEDPTSRILLRPAPIHDHVGHQRCLLSRSDVSGDRQSLHRRCGLDHRPLRLAKFVLGRLRKRRIQQIRRRISQPLLISSCAASRPGYAWRLACASSPPKPQSGARRVSLDC